MSKRASNRDQDQGQDVDWRKLPRKPVDRRRVHQLGVRVTKEEYNAIRLLASERGLVLADYVVRAALNPRKILPSRE